MTDSHPVKGDARELCGREEVRSESQHRLSLWGEDQGATPHEQLSVGSFHLSSDVLGCFLAGAVVLDY